MGFLTISKFLMILILPFVLFLLVLNVVGFNNSFYREKFSKYGVDGNISSLHEKVINFVKGENQELPNEFNERERHHLLDVRKAIGVSTILLYIAIILFILLLIFSTFTLKINNYITNFVGKVLVFGGFLTVTLAAALFLLINYDFSSTFESFHKLLFQQGTYTFDPAKEMIVNLYPEELFMDLGIRISKWVIISAVIIILIGLVLLFKSKNKKNK